MLQGKMNVGVDGVFLLGFYLSYQTHNMVSSSYTNNTNTIYPYKAQHMET